MNESIDDTIIEKIKQLVQIMQKRCKMWMLIGDHAIVTKERNDDFREFLHRIKDDYTVDFVQSKRGHWSFAISNKQCNINGYYEKWIMTNYF